VEILQHKLTYTFLLAILLGALFIRVYNTGIILYFFYDQGRDALEIWELLNKGDIFLIGPTTGIAGIFRGPFYYYLITPIYWLSQGDPVWPANFLALTTVAGIAILYFLLVKSLSRTAGLIGVILAGFSFYLMVAARWLSNPTPMMLLSMLLLLFMFMVLDRKKWAWTGIAFVSGLSLFHFGSSGEFFYFPALVIFLIWQIARKNGPSVKILLISTILFLSTAVPLILFDIKNDWLLSKNINAFLFEKESFKGDFMTVLAERIVFYRDSFFPKIFPTGSRVVTFLLTLVGILFLFYLPEFLKNNKIKTLLLLFISPIVGLLFFQGNEGNIYDYYLTGYFFVFIMLVALVLARAGKTVPGKAVVAVFLIVFLQTNIPIVKARITDKGDGPNTISFVGQKEAIEWAYADAKGAYFNVDVYVPPVIPYAYNYLFTWYESKPDYLGNVEERVELLYTLFEEDPPHPERLEAWLARQDGIGEVEYEQKFGGITVQRRKRIE